PILVGHLTPGWRWTLGFSWGGVLLGFGAVTWSSRSLGLSTWWLGPSTQPRIIFLMLLPFVAPLLMCIGILTNSRWMPFAGLAAALVTGAIGLGDRTRVPGLAAVELALAAAGLLVSLASLSGLYRRGAPAP
ncbi:unnamed protein product, partial [Phaeothamnion confervicola]